MLELLENLWEAPGLLIAGVVLAVLGSEAGRKTVRKVAVKSISAVMAVTAEAKELVTDAKREWNDIIQESKNQTSQTKA